MTTTPTVSVILPARNEAVAITGLLADISAALAGVPHEIIVVDDGSTDDMAQAVLAAKRRDPERRLLRHDRSCGQSAALRSGILAARGRLIAILDADGQNPPADLPRLLAPLLDPGAENLGLVQGQRRRRQERWTRRAGSRIANAIRGALLRDGVRDSGCGLKAFPARSTCPYPISITSTASCPPWFCVRVIRSWSSKSIIRSGMAAGPTTVTCNAPWSALSVFLARPG